MPAKAFVRWSFTEMANFTEAYRSAGYLLKNPRNQWSARKADNSGVALTVWRDEIDKTVEPWAFDCRDHPQFELWGGRQGHGIRKRDIEFSLENLGGHFDLILCNAADPNQQPRRIKSASFWKERTGLIRPVDYDSETGCFRLEMPPAS